MKKLFYIGLDVHRDTIVIAVARSGREPAMQLATIAHDEVALIKRLDDLGPRSLLRVCYEAGPTGYGLARRLNQAGICCAVVAPSLVPVQQGCQIKTDRRDAMKLAHFRPSDGIAGWRADGALVTDFCQAIDCQRLLRRADQARGSRGDPARPRRAGHGVSRLLAEDAIDLGRNCFASAMRPTTQNETSSPSDGLSCKSLCIK